MWSVVEKRDFVPSWHIDAICEHLEAVSRGEILRLIINIPPRHTKSLIVSVMWPMWDWLHHPERQFLFASHAQSLSTRDSVKCRRIFQSNAYQEMLQDFQPDLVLVGDQNTKTRFENSDSGYRLATSVDGSLTGEGGDIIGVDDPHNIRDGESETKRKSVHSWWDEAMSTRLNDPKTGAFVIIMQRSHQEDLTGHILETEATDYDQLIIPARREKKSRIVSSLNLKDPRKKVGMPICSGRFGEKELKKLENSLGSYGTAGQLQQRPSPRGGGMFKVENMTIINAIARNHIESSVRWWDKAGTEGGGCRSAGVLMHKMSSGPFDYIIENVTKGQWSAGNREKRILQTAQTDAELFGGDKSVVKIWTEQEGGSGGKESAEATTRNLAGYNAHYETSTGDKVTRAEPAAAQTEISNIALLSGEWVKEYIDEMEVFPFGKFKDQADGTSGAFNKLNYLGKPKRRVGVF